MPRGVTEYFVKCRGCDSAGFPPQNTTMSARFLISPRVQVASPTAWKAMPEGPWQTDVVVSRQAPTRSAISTATR